MSNPPDAARTAQEMNMEHKLVDGTLYTSKNGIVGTCTCGHKIGPHFTSMSASVAFMDHQERMEKDEREKRDQQ